MNKKMYALLTALILQFGFGYGAYAKAHMDVDDSTYLKIFTPYHSVKQVFKYNTEDNSSIASSKIQWVNDQKSVNAFQRHITEDEINLVAKIVYAESKGEPYKGKVGVASVILNRLSHPDFPKTVKEVIFQKNAFSCINLDYNNITPDIETYNAVSEALNGHDPTNNAVFFYNPATARCKWMKKVSKDSITVIGNHVFFK